MGKSDRHDRGPPRGPPVPRGGHKCTIRGLPSNINWRDLKDFMSKAGTVNYTDMRGDHG